MPNQTSTHATRVAVAPEAVAAAPAAAKPAKPRQAAKPVKAAKPATVAKAAKPSVAKKPAVKKATAKAPVAKPVPAKPRPKPQAKAAAKPAKPVAAEKPVVAPKVKQKLVRDSFTMPRVDFDLIDALKERALGFKRPTKKSELLRAGLQVLNTLSAAQLSEVLGALAPLKAGRPKNDA